MNLQKGNKSELTTEKSGALGVKTGRKNGGEMEVKKDEKKAEETADNE